MMIMAIMAMRAPNRCMSDSVRHSPRWPLRLSLRFWRLPFAAS
jgi:hypothetical protein